MTDDVYSNGILKKAISEMDDRALIYDSEKGERSMAKTVAMFNTLYDSEITETQGWVFMQILKMVRAGQGKFKEDNYVDGAAYCALAAESSCAEREALETGGLSAYRRIGS